MKKILTVIVLLACIAKVFSQEQTKTRDYYLNKSKSQKTTAYSLLIIGGVGVGAGFLIGDSKNSSFSAAGAGAILGGLGFLSMLGSIPLFLASSKNKRKASLVLNSGNIQYRPGVNTKLLNIGIAVSL